MFDSAPLEFKYRLSHVALLLAALVGIYLLTMPQFITLEDAGIFQMVCHLGGISHPPGYPLFTQICQQLMFSDSVIWANLVSTYFALAAVFVLYLLVFELNQDHFIALIAAFAYGFSQCLWSQAIIVEVYSLAAFQFLLCWWLLLRFTRTQSLATWYVLCLNVGLALSNHWPLFVLSCLGFVTILWRHRSLILTLVNPQVVSLSALLLLLGLSPYLLLFQADPAIAMYGDVSTRKFIPYLLREYYSDDHASATFHDKLQFLRWVFPLTSLQLGWLALPFVVLGIGLAWRQLRREDFASIVLIFLSTTFFLVGLLNFRFELHTKAIFLPYPIIAVAVVAIAFSLGFTFVFRALQNTNKAFAGLFAMALLISIIAANYPQLDRSSSRIANEYAQVILGGLEPDAVLFVGGDNQIGPIGFSHRVQGLRPDVSVYSLDGLLFSERIVPLNSSPSERLKYITEFAETSDRPVYTLIRLTENDVHFGLYFLFQGGSSRESLDRSKLLRPDIGRFTDYLINLYMSGLINDLHEKVFIHSLIVDVTEQYSLYALAHGTDAMSSNEVGRLANLQATLPGKMSSLRTLLMANSQAGELLELGLAMESQLHESVSNQHDALAYEFIARIYLSLGNDKEAIVYFIKSIDAFPTSTNASLCAYKSLVSASAFDQNLANFEFDNSKCLP